MSVRRLVAALLALTVTSGLAACGEEKAAPLPRTTALNGTVFNSADARFARDLLVQRSREFALIDVTVGRPLGDDLAAFLDGARTVRAAEIDQVTTWLTDWGREVPATIRDHASEDAGAHVFADLEKASDAGFARAWVAAYRKELEASDDVAATEQKAGLYRDARALAASVAKANSREADELTDNAD